MESSTSKAEVIRPVLLKAGIPLAVSVAGFIYARIMASRSINSKASSLETQVSSLQTNSHREFRGEDSLHSLNSSSSPSPFVEDEDGMITSTPLMNLTESSEIQENYGFEEEILGLRTRVEELQKREWELEIEFLRYRDLKEQESLIMELRNMLLMEIAYAEFLDREISSMEAENKRLEHFSVQYQRVLEQLDSWKLENGLLQRKVKKLSRKTIGQSRVIREKNSKIEAREAEILRNCDALDRRSNVIKTLEEEIQELQSVIDQLQEQKNELLNKLTLAEKSVSPNSKTEDEGKTMEDYKQLLNEYEKLQKDQAAEVKELIYLRWSNACLRHELMRNYEQQERIKEQKYDLELDFEGNGKTGDYVLEHAESSLSGVITTTGHASKRPKLLQKLKRWVEGSDQKLKSKLDEEEKHESKCFGRHSVSDGAEEEHVVQARRFCPSA